MKGIKNKMWQVISGNFKFLKIAFFTLLLLGSYTSLAQSSFDTDDVNSISNESKGQVNINLADAETIAMILDGVGINRAEAIVDYRESNGDFEDIDDLIMVTGIGEITLRNNADKILLVSE